MGSGRRLRSNRGWAHPEEIIVELKAAEEYAAELAGIATAMPLQPVAHSKYAAGLLTALAR